MTISILEKHFKHQTFEEIEPLLKELSAKPEKYYNHPLFDKVAERIKPKPEPEKEKPELRHNPLIYNTFGVENIEKGALLQMDTAMRLPITVSGALMPDAHAGYGLPIGGVLATEGAVIPYGVGVDIGCRMSLSIFPLAGEEFVKREKMFEQALVTQTLFGAGGNWGKMQAHEVIESAVFDDIPILRDFRGRAARQLGTSGSGNHFVEFGIVSLDNDDAELGLKKGTYVGLLSHSGSRSLGATVANHYTNIAMKKRHLTGDAKQLAWLRLDEQEGIEYWLAMNLAGEYSAACHENIHARIAQAIDLQPLVKIENHHNFAWKETIEGKECIVHRKGATPAGKGVLGIIPANMVSPGYIVRGKGEVASLHSAAHGAGRKMNRKRAKQSITHHALKQLLDKHAVTLIGGNLDEAPHAYKDIEAVMQSQKALVSVVGTFLPKIVKMDRG